MPDVELPEREVFEHQVKQLERRIEGITQKNTMAGLLNNNFKKWLAGSSMSALTLTDELDTDTNGYISGDEFATLLGRMTGERPPDWVTEIVFSFVNATPSQGIPLHDWYAFLAASGLEIPDELFKQQVPVIGTIDIVENDVMADEPFSVRLTFNMDVVGYGFTITSRDSTLEPMNRKTLAASMVRPDYDEFTIEVQSSGHHTLELTHLGERLDTHELTVLPQPEPVHVEEEPAEAEPHHEEEEVEAYEPTLSDVENQGKDGFEAFVSTMESVKLRSEAQGLIAQAPSYNVHGIIHSVSRTLLGAGMYRNGHTVHCEGGYGVMFRVMLKPCETAPAAGDHFQASVALHDWDVALKQMVCLEV